MIKYFNLYYNRPLNLGGSIVKLYYTFELHPHIVLNCKESFLDHMIILTFIIKNLLKL